MEFGNGRINMRLDGKLKRCDAAEMRGFTLLETMVVVGIIMILVTLAIPLGQAGVRASKEATCVKGLKVIYGAAQMYEMENGFGPVHTSTPSSVFMEEIDPFMPEAIDRVHSQNVLIKGYRLFGWVPEDSSIVTLPVIGGSTGPVIADRLGSRNWRIIAVPIEPFSGLSTFFLGPDGNVSRELDGKPV